MSQTERMNEPQDGLTIVSVRNLQDYLAQVRKRPAMYLGENTFTKLRDHLQGYRMGIWITQTEMPVDKHFFDNFHEFVCKYYGVSRGAYWCGAILEQCHGNEEAALEQFFELYDLFVADAKTMDTKKTVLAVLDMLVLQQDELKQRLGADFTSVAAETLELVKHSLLTRLKADYDHVHERLLELSERLPELDKIMKEL